jgi:hypothetical protein
MPGRNKESHYTIKTKARHYDAMLDRGFVYVLPFVKSKPGLYQFRVVVRDTATGMIGSGTAIIEVPDSRKSKSRPPRHGRRNVSNETWLNIAQGKSRKRPDKIQVPIDSLVRHGASTFSSQIDPALRREIYSSSKARIQSTRLRRLSITIRLLF